VGDILIVDDSPDNLRLLFLILARKGYAVRTVTNGQQALTAALVDPPDLILLDIVMPGMNGYETCERLKAEEQTCDIPVLFLSALDATQDKVKAFALGGVDYITKPFQAEEVLARVATHLSLRELQKRLRVANHELEERNAELRRRNAELQEALEAIKTLSGLIPICAWCGRKIEDEGGRWIPVEIYIETHSEATFTHGMCPDCYEKQVAKVRQLHQSRTEDSRP
jgi:DNA-binding response OmpR family regulator